MPHAPLATPELLGLALMMVFAAALVRGFAGFGFSIVSVPLLSLIMLPAQAIPISLLLQVLVSLIGLREAMRICDWGSIRMIVLGALLGTPFGVWLLTHLPVAAVRLAITGIVVLGAVLLARGFRMRTAPRGAGAVPFGMASGLFNGLAGISGPPVIAFYLASPIGTAVARSSMIVIFMAISTIALLPLAALGAVGWSTLVAGGLGFPVLWIGSRLGAAFFRRSPERIYRIVALSLLIATALIAGAHTVFDLI
jgi:uncharacterized membrane protein YfcA